MKGIFKVGGCVRDKILNRKPKDTDFVVVGYTEEEFLEEFPKAKRQGNSFPVYVVDKCEYAFARKEMKVSSGHTGFEVSANPEVTLFEDLYRRDLTINAVAEDSIGNFYSITGDFSDFNNKVLRHVSKHFTEDPLRAYRVARFAAQMPDFVVAEETLEIMSTMKEEMKFLSLERVYNEMFKALESKKPSRFFDVLKAGGVLNIHFKVLDDSTKVPAGSLKQHPEGSLYNHLMFCLDNVVSNDPVIRFAAMCHDLGKLKTDPLLYPKFPSHDVFGIRVVDQFSESIKASKKMQIAGRLASKYHMVFHKIEEVRPIKAAKISLILESSFPGGIKNFLKVMESDGFSNEKSKRILEMVSKIKLIKLPEKHENRGVISGEILAHLRGIEWRKEFRKKKV